MVVSIEQTARFFDAVPQNEEKPYLNFSAGT